MINPSLNNALDVLQVVLTITAIAIIIPLMYRWMNKKGKTDHSKEVLRYSDGHLYCNGHRVKENNKHENKEVDT